MDFFFAGWLQIRRTHVNLHAIYAYQTGIYNLCGDFIRVVLDTFKTLGILGKPLCTIQKETSALRFHPRFRLRQQKELLHMFASVRVFKLNGY